MAVELRIERDAPAAGILELRVHGDVDLVGGRRLRDALETAVDSGDAVLVNLRDCTFLDSSGLSALIRASRAMPSPRRFAVFCLPEGIVRQVFSLTRAHTLLDVHADREQALATLAP